jgi:hypothetical protein
VPPVAVASAAALGERDRPGQIAALLGPGGRDRQAVPEAGPLARVGEAAHRRTSTGAAGVPADDVEAAAGHRVQGLAPAGQVADRRQVDARPTGMPPVQRHRHGGALQPRPAGGPADPPGARGAGVGGSGHQHRQQHADDQVALAGIWAPVRSTLNNATAVAAQGSPATLRPTARHGKISERRTGRHGRSRPRTPWGRGAPAPAGRSMTSRRVPSPSEVSWKTSS